jgi:hypothetical protein
LLHISDTPGYQWLSSGRRATARSARSIRGMFWGCPIWNSSIHPSSRCAVTAWTAHWRIIRPSCVICQQIAAAVAAWAISHRNLGRCRVQTTGRVVARVLPFARALSAGFGCGDRSLQLRGAIHQLEWGSASPLSLISLSWHPRRRLRGYSAASVS